MSDPPEPERDTNPRPGLWTVLALAAAACGPGLALWAVTRPDRGAYLLNNALAGSPRAGLVWAAGSAVPVLGWLWWMRRRRPDVGYAALVRALAPLALAPAIALLYAPGVERSAQWLCSGLIAAVAVATGLFAHQLAAWIPPPPPRWRWIRERAPPWALALVGALVGASLTQLGLVRHWNLDSRIFDLGIFDNLLYQATQGRWQATSVLRGGSFTSAHCAPILQLLAPIYALAPRAETLIVFQVWWVIGGVIPLYRVAARALAARPHARWLAAAVGVVYLCHPSVHAVAVFDFHALTLAGPLLLWSLDLLHARAWRRYALATLALALVREDVAFVVIGLGLYAALELARDRRDRRVGLSTIALGIVTLALTKFVFMTDAAIFMANSEGSYAYGNRFSGVIPDPATGGVRELVLTVFTNPGFVVKHALTQAKFLYLVTLTLPCLGLCFWQRRAWLPMAFGLSFLALASGRNLANPYLHYTVHLVPAALFATIFGIESVLSRATCHSSRSCRPDHLEASRRRALALIAALACAGALSGERFGALGRSERFLAGHTGILRALTPAARERLAWIEHVRDELIDPRAAVSASNFLGAHFSARDELYHVREHPEADVLVVAIDEIGDRAWRRLLRRERAGEYERVATWRDEIVVLRRRDAAAGSDPR